LKKWDNTSEWNAYESGKTYNEKLDLYTNTDLNWDFYKGNQWAGIKTAGLPCPVFNISRSSINYFISSIMSQHTKMVYSVENIPDNPELEEDIEVVEFVKYLSGYAEIKWEKEKMDFKLRQCLLDGANSGDFCIHTYWNPFIKTGQAEKGDFETELVDGVNVMFGNPNNTNVEKQPYILIIGRDMVSNLKKEAEANKVNKDLIESIEPDINYDYQAGKYGKYELEKRDNDGKCLYLIKYWKKDGKVYWNKSTKYCPIRKDVELHKGSDADRYPVAFGNWEMVKNCYHGNPVMSGIIPNQIIINQMFAMVTYWMRMNAFGKTCYDATRISAWTNTIGKAIPVMGDCSGVIQQLQAGSFNSGIFEIIDKAIKYTKDFIGASDAALGNIRPENTSAIIAVQKASSVPLENIQKNLWQFVEDIGLIWAEFILKKYVNRKISYKVGSETKVTQINTEKFRDILLQCKIDVGSSNQWSEIMAMQTLDNLLLNNKIDVVQYLERVPGGNIPKLQELINEKRQELEQVKAQQQAQIQQKQADEEKQVAYEQMASFMETLSPQVQAKLKAMPDVDMEQAVMALMKQSGGNING